MRCPYCGSFNGKVIDSRILASGSKIRRRRECTDCGYRFTSYESVEERQLMVVKKDGRRQPFDRQKLERGLTRALEKRPFSNAAIENLLNEIEDAVAIEGKRDGEIASSRLGEIVLDKLYKTDKVAYIRFASVYRHFDNLDEFILAIKKAEETNG